MISPVFARSYILGEHSIVRLVSVNNVEIIPIIYDFFFVKHLDKTYLLLPYIIANMSPTSPSYQLSFGPTLFWRVSSVDKMGFPLKHVVHLKF